MRVLAAAVLINITLHAPAAEVRVFAAASLAEALEEIGAAYERASGDDVVFNFGASGMLARQIELGAPADVFLSADEQRMNELEKRGLLAAGSRFSVLSNRLAVVVPRDSRARMTTAAELARLGAIAIGDPSDVPAGLYARTWLTRAGVWGRIAPKTIPTANVRAALAAVEAGNADAAIVYRTDTLVSKRVRVAFVVTGATAPLISYPFAAIAAAENRDGAKRLLAWLRSAPARAVFARRGFIVR